MWKALLWKDLRANALVLLGLWGVILAAAGLALFEPWREGVVMGFTILAPMVVAGLLTVTLGTAEAAQGTAPFLDGLPASRRQVWGMKALLVGLYLAAVALLSLGLTAFLVRTAPLLDDRPQAAREWAVQGPVMLGLSLQAAAFVALLGFAGAVASTSVKQAALRLLFWGGVLVTAVVLVQVRLGQAIFLETVGLPLLDWLFRAVLFGVALIAAGAAWRQATWHGPLDAPLRRRRIGRAAFLGAAIVALLAAPIYFLSPRGTVHDIVRVDHARFSPDGRQLLLQTVTRRWGREFLGRLWYVDCETGAAQPFGPGYGPEWSGVSDFPVQYRRRRQDPIALVLCNPATGRTRPLPLPKRIRREMRSGVRYARLGVRDDTGEVFFHYRSGFSPSPDFYLSPGSSTPQTFSTPDGQPLSFFVWDHEPAGAFMLTETQDQGSGRGLWWVELPSGRMRELAHNDHRLRVEVNLLSPDGQWLYYWSPRGKDLLAEGQDLCVVRRDGTGGRVVKEKALLYSGSSQWSADSRYLATFPSFQVLVIHEVPSGVTQRFTMEVDDPHFPRETWTGYPEQKQWHPGCYTESIHPTWSLDSQYLAFAVVQRGMVRREETDRGHSWWHQTTSLWVFDRTSGHARRVATLSDMEYDQRDPLCGMNRWWGPVSPVALAWDARGRILVVTGTGEFFAVEPETGKQMEVW